MKQENREKLQRVRGALHALQLSYFERGGMNALFSGLKNEVAEVLDNEAMTEDAEESEVEECND